ncbi:MAG: ATP-grasp domain-containing protein [Planctomycetes bacterium]|nr:ATP-grasp domain-containing protein [Planctomycetota bacterium]
MKRILVTGAGGSAGINFIESLRMSKESFYIVGGDINRWHLELPRIDKGYILPYYNEPDYMDKLNGLIEKEKIEMVHTQPDIELDIISENREKVSARVFLPAKETLRVCRSKLATNVILSRNKIPIPLSYQIGRIEDIPDIMKKLQKRNEVVWLRAIKGAGSKAALPVRSFRQAKEWIHYWRATKRLESKDFMLAEYLPGREFAFQSLWKDGKLVTSQARSRLEYYMGNLFPSGQSSSPSVAATVHRRDVNRIAARAILGIDKKATGVFCVDMKENEKGMPCVTEVNAGRFFTTSNFFSLAGVNMPYYYVKLAYGEKLPQLKQYNALPENLYWIRLPDKGPILVKGERWKSRKI